MIMRMKTYSELSLLGDSGIGFCLDGRKGFLMIIDY